MKKIVLEPIIKDEDVIVQFTDSIEISKKIIVTVPAYFKAIAYVDEEAIVRIDECNEKSLFDLLEKNKTFLKKKIQLAFIRTNDIPNIDWGLGPVECICEGKERYSIGSSGEAMIKLNNRKALIDNFGLMNNITIEMLSIKVKGVIKEKGSQVIAENLKNVPSCEKDLYRGVLKNKLLESLKDNSIINSLGLSINDLTIKTLQINKTEKIYEKSNDEISKSDLVNLESKINKKIIDSQKEMLKKKDVESIKEDIKNSLVSDFGLIDYESMKEEIYDMLDEATKDTIKASDLDDIKEELQESFNFAKNNDNFAVIDDKIADLEKRLNVTISTKIDIIKELYNSIIDEAEQNKIALYETAKKEYLDEITITTDLLIEKAKKDEDFATPAGTIYTNVEKNLMESPDMINNGVTFIASQDKYYDVAKLIMKETNGLDLLKSFNPRIVETKDGIDYIELPTQFRFIIYGVSVKDAFQAADDWCLLNKFRHMSEDNTKKLEKRLKERKMSRKEFLVYILDFYRKLKLFTKD